MVKKKVTSELELYFPDEFVNAKEKDVYDKLKNRTLLILDSIITDSDNSKQIDDIDVVLFSMYKPKSFLGSISVEIEYDKQFENMCFIIAQKANMDAKNMTVLQFYNAIDTIKRNAEAEAKIYKNNKINKYGRK